jgi:ABC-type dipeptide/oligopeptide/nickel transport system permease component
MILAKEAIFNGKHHFTRCGLGIRPLAVVIQLMRNSLLETFGQDYIRTARAKDLNFKSFESML